MLRISALVLLALLLAQATGLPAFAEPDGCATECPGEQSGGDCPPDCAWCACCPSARPLIVESTEVPLPAEWREAPFEAAVPVISTPDPHEITHVPRFLS